MIYTVSNGSGGSPNVLIKTETGATVTLSKGDVVLTKVAENGEALFESVEYGTWTAVATLDDNTATQQIEVPQTIEQEVTLGLMLSSLPLKTTKLKIGGIKWILFARDHDGYPSGAQTLISEFTVDPNTAFGSSVNYQGSSLQARMGQVYNLFSEREKSFVLQTTRKYKNGSGAYPIFNEYVFPLTSTEVGDNTDPQMGSNLGFSSNDDRKCTNTSGSAQIWWLADASLSSVVRVVGSGGGFANVSPSVSNGVRPALNLSPNTILNEYPDDEGYYTIYRPVETANDLIVGDKVKIGGTKYIVKAKGHEGYPQNAVTLISEYLLQSSKFGSTTNYDGSTLETLCETYYDQLSQAEKDAIMLTTRKIKNSSGAYPEFSEHIFILNSTEVGGTSDSQMGSNLGFANNNDRICKDEGGTAQTWWLADAYSSEYVWNVAPEGYSNNHRGPANTFAVRPALNLSPTAPIAAMDNTGYYSIVGADTISTLKDKSLEILGVKL